MTAPKKRLDWKDCGSKQVQFNNIDLNPHPVIIPGKVQLSVDAQLKRSLNGRVKATITMYSVQKFMKVKVPCMTRKIEGVPLKLGSCVFEDLCEHYFQDLIQTMGCEPQIEAIVGCTCPFNLKSLDINIDKMTLDFSKVSKQEALFLIGTYEVRIETEDASGPLGCLSLTFTSQLAN